MSIKNHKRGFRALWLLLAALLAPTLAVVSEENPQEVDAWYLGGECVNGTDWDVWNPENEPAEVKVGDDVIQIIPVGGFWTVPSGIDAITASWPGDTAPHPYSRPDGCKPPESTTTTSTTLPPVTPSATVTYECTLIEGSPAGLLKLNIVDVDNNTEWKFSVDGGGISIESTGTQYEQYVLPFPTGEHTWTLTIGEVQFGDTFNVDDDCIPEETTSTSSSTTSTTEPATTTSTTQPPTTTTTTAISVPEIFIPTTTSTTIVEQRPPDLSVPAATTTTSTTEPPTTTTAPPPPPTQQPKLPETA